MLQKVNTILLLLAVILLAVIVVQQRSQFSDSQRFRQLGDSEEFGLDTKTGQVCLIWPSVTRPTLKTPDMQKTPACRDLR